MKLTDEDIDKLRAIRDKRKERIAYRIDEDICDSIRERYLNGEEYSALADEHSVRNDTIAYHLRDDCQCENEIPHIQSETTEHNVILHCPDCEQIFKKYGDLTEHINQVHK